MNIFIIDDDLSFCKSLKRLVNARGFSADYFLSAQSFLDSISPDQKKAIVILDINMPECDGFALMDKMQDTGYHLPVIVITGHAGPETQHIAIQKRAIGFLKKPFSEKSILDLIESQTQKHRKYD